MERFNLDKVKIMAAAATLAMFAGTASAHLEVYGEVNKLFEQVWTNKQDVGAFADNNYSPSKFGVMSSAHLNKCVTFGGIAELELLPNNTRLVSQRKTDGVNDRIVFVRKVDSWISGGQWGTLRLGLGESASWDITNISFSGTNQTSLGSSVANNAGGMIFAVKGADATTSDPTINQAFNAMNGVGDNDLGIYNTENRVRYDTADWMGFKVGVSYGSMIKQGNSLDQTFANNVAGQANRKTYFDAALRYSACWDDFMFGAGIAGAWYNRDGQTTVAPNTATGSLRHERVWSGSIAAEHKPTGFNAAVAGGVRRKIVGTLHDHKFWYVQLGKRSCLTTYGKTDVAIDYFDAKDAVYNGDKPKSFGLGVTQHFTKINSAIYASLRNYKYSDVPGKDYQDVFVASVGVQFKFGAML